MIKVGITGGIGSGKTTVCAIFERLGVPVYYADKRATELMTESKELVSAIKALLGDEAYQNDGSLNTKYISGIVFNDEDKLLKLNALVHPAVQKDYDSWTEVLASKNFAYCLKEAALLVETGLYKDLDKLIVVSAPLEDRIRRVVTRDNTTEEQVLKRKNAQLNEAEKVNLADYVIVNDKVTDLVPQVSKIHFDLMSVN